MTDDDLTPADRLSDYWVEFAGLDVIANIDGAATFRFDIVRGTPGDYRREATLSFDLEPQGDGIAGMLVRAHDLLVDALRQMTFDADKARRHYRKAVAASNPPGSGDDSQGSPEHS